jgi:hypothetical protein
VELGFAVLNVWGGLAQQSDPTGNKNNFQINAVKMCGFQLMGLSLGQACVP